MLTWSTFRSELRPTLRLALPLVLAEIGWMSMAIVDTMMVGRLPNSAASIAAVSISSNIFHVLAFFGEGILIGVGTLRPPALLSPPVLQRIHGESSIIDLAIPYTYALAAGMLSLLLYFAVRRALQAM